MPIASGGGRPDPLPSAFRRTAMADRWSAGSTTISAKSTATCSRALARLRSLRCRLAPGAREIPSPAVCSMFRTFQGWTALTRQGKGDGTLQLIPIANAWCTCCSVLSRTTFRKPICAGPSRAGRFGAAGMARPASRGAHVDPVDGTRRRGVLASDVVHAVEDEHKGRATATSCTSAPPSGAPRTRPTWPGRRRPSWPAGLRPISLPTISKSISGDAARKPISLRSEEVRWASVRCSSRRRPRKDMAPVATLKVHASGSSQQIRNGKRLASAQILNRRTRKQSI